MMQWKYRMILNYCRSFLAQNIQTRKNKIKLLMQYESATQEALLHAG
jgi:hypothetical protein